MKTAVAVVIVNYNSAGYLRRCLEALSKQHLQGFRVILVDNASTDGSAGNLERDFPWVEVIRSPRNLGFAAGNNLGAASAAGCEWLITLNPDAFADPGWFSALLEAAQRHPEFSMFQARLITEADPRILDGVGDVYHVSGLYWRAAHMCPAEPIHDQPREIFSPCAASAMYRKAAFDQAGGFDEDFFCYGEDVDLGFRLRLAGHRALYVPDALVFHIGSGTTGWRSDFSVYHGQRNLVWTFAKNMPAALLVASTLLHIVANLASLAVWAARGQGMVALRAKFDALCGLGKMLKKRAAIQASRSVTLRWLWSSMAKGWPRRHAGARF